MSLHYHSVPLSERDTATLDEVAKSEDTSIPVLCAAILGAIAVRTRRFCQLAAEFLDAKGEPIDPDAYVFGLQKLIDEGRCLGCFVNTERLGLAELMARRREVEVLRGARLNEAIQAELRGGMFEEEAA